jgi:hypothetical protein
MKNPNRVRGALTGQETRRLSKPIERRIAQLRVNLPSQHFHDAIKAEAAIRNMSVSSFMRAMIRGYFGAA